MPKQADTPMTLSGHARSIRTGLFRATVIASLLSSLPTPDGAQAQWTQFGGPEQNFKANSKKLAEAWPADGPPELWSRELGEGYSSILAEGDRLYTMYRVDREERVISLDAATGKTLWEYGYKSWPGPQHEFGWGNGPNATPLLTGGRLYAIGITGLMHCFEAATGTLIWSQILWREPREKHPHRFGYTSSPIEYAGTIITEVGERNRSIVALDPKNGKVIFETLDFANSYGTPRILNLNGMEQLIAFPTTGVIGVDPHTGRLLWEYALGNKWDQNSSAPVLIGDNMLFAATIDAGARGLRLIRNGERTVVEEAWSTPKIRVTYANWICIDDHIYGCAGQIGNFLLAAVHTKTGRVAWRKRGFGQAHVVYADGRLLVLDEHGTLALATATPQDLTVHSRVKLLQAPSRTPPTVVGRTLYARDFKKIMAVDLG